MRSSIPWFLVLALTSCGEDSGSAGLAVQGISVPDFGSWESNRPIEFAFNQPIDFASVSGQSIRIRTSLGVPAAGTFEPRSVDADGDGVPEEVDESVVVFHPSCSPDDPAATGLTPGARYLITLAGLDSGADPAALLRSRTGAALARTVVHAFEAIATPLADEKPGAAPLPVLRAAGASAGRGCHLELGGDPASTIYFEAGPVPGRPPSGFLAPLNLLGDPASRVAFVLVFDQLVDPSPANLTRLWLEYSPVLTALDWERLETRAELVSNCPPEGAAVRLVALGAFPPGGFVRARVGTAFRDALGEATTVALHDFALTPVATAAFASLDPADALAAEIREEFDFGPGSPLSFADPDGALDGAPAHWGEGELRASHEVVVLPPGLRDFDWVVRNGERFVFDTSATAIAGGPDGSRDTVQETTAGFVLVRNLLVEQGGSIQVRGPNPMVVHASGNVTIGGRIEADGMDAEPVLGGAAFPGVGGQGTAGGGAGASGVAGAQTRGAAGSAAFGAGPGGEGGESGFAPPVVGETRRGAGGGGGRFAADQPPLVAERGGNGTPDCTGAENGLSPPRGGAPGPDVFVDGDPSNDFFGIQPIVDAGGAVIGRRRGELDHVHAGMGGGSSGDSILSGSFPPPPNAVVEGGGGGGGGGALVIRASGRIVFGPSGLIRANGGRGERRGFGPTFDGACGGSGSGGHVILESAEAIDFTAGDPAAEPRNCIEAVGGPRVLNLPNPRGIGGAGGPGVVQLHVPRPERAPGAAGTNVILPSAALVEPDPLAAVCRPRPVILYPSVGSLSRGLSRWIPLGAAGEEAPGRPASVVALLFGGIETAPGEDHGRVLTSAGHVVELAPLLGPASLAQPGIELLADGTSLALSDAVLAPLRASAQPISPDVYLRTPALLVGFTLRLANAADPARRADLTVAAARYDDAAARLTLAAGGLAGTLAEAVAELGGPSAVELAFVPRFFRVRLGSSGADLLPDSRVVRILFQGAADDGTGRPDEDEPLVDWTADPSAFGALPPGALDFVRFQVEFELDTSGDDFDPEAEPLALEFLRLPLRF